MKINLLPKKHKRQHRHRLLISGYILAIFGVILAGGLFRAEADIDISSTNANLAPNPLSHFEAVSALSGEKYVPLASPVAINREKAIPILMYHYIRKLPQGESTGAGLSVSPEQFEKQLQAIKDAGYTAITFKDLSLPLPEKPIILTFDDGYDDAYGDAFPKLRKAGMRGVFYIVNEYVGKSGYANEAQVKEMAQGGMEIGAHTQSHRDLSKMGESDQEKQLVESKAGLEKLLGLPVLSLCYPTGKYNDLTVKLAKKAGYTTATTTKRGIATGAAIQDSPYELKRVRVTESSNLEGMLRSL